VRCVGGSRLIFTVLAEKDSTYDTCIVSTLNSSGSFSMLTNGHHQADAILLNSSSSCLPLSLRKGINSIVLTTLDGLVDLDYITVKGASKVNDRGATVPYEEYEAEDSQHTGSIIGPDRTFRTLASEASGRRAVQIQNNQYIQFKLRRTANAIVVRYSIPDNQDGSGNNAQLYVQSSDGTVIAKLTLTSAYSWAYGDYPFTKIPSQGKAHRFYDESRSLLNKRLQAGETLRLVPTDRNILYTIDLIDAYDVPDPYSRPEQSLSVIDFGADPSGQLDSTSAIQRTIDQAIPSNKVVWIPTGVYQMSNKLQVNHVVIRGQGPWYSVLFASKINGVGIDAYGDPTQLYDFSIIGKTSFRIESDVDRGFGGQWKGGIIQNVWIEHVKCGGWLDGPFSGVHLVALTIRNTFADGINFSKGVSNAVITQSTFRNTGDDSVAFWNSGALGSDNVVSYNTIQLPMLANGVALYGGQNNKLVNLLVSDTLYEGTGLQVSNRYDSRVAVSGETLLSECTLVRCGAQNRWSKNPSDGHGAVWIWSENSPMNTALIVRDFDILDSSFASGTFWGTQTTNVHFDNVRINGAPYAFQVKDVSGQATFTNVVAKNIQKTGVHSCQPNFKIVYGLGCSGWNSTSC